jgi:exonuclease VII small subunit
MAEAWNGIANVRNQRGELEEALPAYTEGLRLARAAGERITEAMILGNMGAL